MACLDPHEYGVAVPQSLIRPVENVELLCDGPETVDGALSEHGLGGAHSSLFFHVSMDRDYWHDGSVGVGECGVAAQ